ncbi:UDP-N-acetylmuramoyl-tripeptide--D-alanyl-D-alanine ligase [Persicimonas caeni]|uniref:UDP-N-acetylmuramoyl-tripeptide--D-alanyl-D-alanine ligase n=1 Tax=Persicimonas caeni TaxID=2292766 RepID=A0A4Y6Q461_PERCE|nr:UDP-N-acetylmuramoyl-tripeptide--D-alanyl-D-alanine ligase [Persicimonas caeni]QDG54775.1 UDP-N-acetylmuramoyl-tripeptide--D-alanyl-D-alanine ligase [Persicimonas caeni]QED35996.1 UDP-N-acetylmuramoyl-tripeptide--D-alanyl-D-alanine ligase [Persicimonas caeni]
MAGILPDNSLEPRRIASWTLAKIADAVGGHLQGADAANIRPSRVSSDTRSLKGGELFVALRGENFDAHDFLARAEEAGAVAAMVDRTEGLDTDLPLVIVDDTLDGLTALGTAVWQEASEAGLHTIDVTGSNGKTTVKEMLALLWGVRGAVFATPGNLNNHIGVPLVLCDIPADCDHLVLEMGANGPDEISHLVALAPGTERIITSIGVAHIEGFGSVDGIRRGKSEIFEGADEETTAIVPYTEVDNLIGADFPGRVITVGFEEEADLTVRLLEPDEAGREALRVSVSFGDDEWTICLPIPGEHHALNVGTSIATLLARGLSLREDMCNAQLAELALPQGRWRVVEVDEKCFVDDAYNANPSSMKASFDAFMGTNDPDERPRVAIIGEMLELGADAEEWHLEVAAAIAGHKRLDAFIAVGEFADKMAEAARANAAGPLEAKGFAEVAHAARWLASKGPAFVFLKASRGARLERVVDLIEAKGEKRPVEQT